MSKRKKRARQAAEERAWTELHENLASLESRFSTVMADLTAQLPDLLQAALSQSVERIVESYRAAEAMRQKEVLVEDHKGWTATAANYHSGVLV